MVKNQATGVRCAWALAKAHVNHTWCNDIDVRLHMLQAGCGGAAVA